MRHKGGLGAAGSHPAVFPVALVEAVLAAFTDPGDLVYEPFCGSGSQLVAAERARRRCCAVELDPAYCDVAVRRWEMATGRKARLDNSDKNTEDMRCHRNDHQRPNLAKRRSGTDCSDPARRPSPSHITKQFSAGRNTEARKGPLV